MNTKPISKAKFHKDLDVDFKVDMHLCAEVDFDLAVITDHVKRLLSTMQHNNLVKARNLVDDFIKSVETLSDDESLSHDF